MTVTVLTKRNINSVHLPFRRLYFHLQSCDRHLGTLRGTGMNFLWRARRRSDQWSNNSCWLAGWPVGARSLLMPHVCLRAQCMHACARIAQLSSLRQGNEPYFTAASNSSLRCTSHRRRNTLRYWLFCLDGSAGWWVGGDVISRRSSAGLPKPYYTETDHKATLSSDKITCLLHAIWMFYHKSFSFLLSASLSVCFQLLITLCLVAKKKTRREREKKWK